MNWVLGSFYFYNISMKSHVGIYKCNGYKDHQIKKIDSSKTAVYWQ